MTLKLPKEILKELDDQVLLLSKGNTDDRARALGRLESFEKSGKIPLSALIELSEDDNVNLAMYGIGALGRNQSKDAVKKLVDLFEKYREGDPLFLETIVDAMGATAHKDVLPCLLNMLGVESGWKKKLTGWLGNRKKKTSEVDPFELKRREFLALPVMRALEKIPDASAAKAIGGFLGHADSLVRWHTIRVMQYSRVEDFKEEMTKLAETDPIETVREAAEIALEELSSPLPENMNN